MYRSLVSVRNVFRNAVLFKLRWAREINSLIQSFFYVSSFILFLQPLICSSSQFILKH